MIDSASLPPLNTLRVFEAVARHLSFTQAAKELYVTQAAVSHQIKSLEDHLGVKLFSRVNRRVLMTEEAQMLLPSVISAFSNIQDAIDYMAIAVFCRQSRDAPFDINESSVALNNLGKNFRKSIMRP